MLREKDTTYTCKWGTALSAVSEIILICEKWDKKKDTVPLLLQVFVILFNDATLKSKFS